MLLARFIPLVEHFILRESGLANAKTACTLGCNTIQGKPHLSFRLPVSPPTFAVIISLFFNVLQIK